VASEPVAIADDEVDDGIASGAKEGTTVIERVLREVGNGTTFSMLTKNNYSDWTMMMRVKLKVRGLRVAVSTRAVSIHKKI
jgi:hypothetical protein